MAKVSRGRKKGDESIVVGYIRVSTDDQLLSPAAQRDSIERWCRKNDRGLAYVAEDLGVSGASDLDKRPGLIEAIAAIREHRAGCLLVFRHDRLSRDVSKGAVIETIVEREGAKILACDGVGNDSSPEGQLLKNMIRSISQYERQIIAMRTRVVLQMKKERGLRYNCRPPYGYVWTPEGAMKPHPREQRAVSMICAMRAKGSTISEIAGHLNDRGDVMFPPRGREWHPTTVYRIACRFKNAVD